MKPDSDTGTAGPARRLDSWKEIANHLNRDVRTVQRWEKEEGLPVHRLLHGKQGSVYALGTELDAWWESRSTQVGADTRESQPDANPHDRSKERRRRLFGIAGVATLVVLIAALAALLSSRAGGPPERAQVVRLAVAPPGGSMRLEYFSPPSVSPDGRIIVFTAPASDGRTRLWVRPLNSTDLREVRDTEGALFPFWSPDSQSIGFFGGGQLQVVPVSGGPPRRICDAPAGSGGTWNKAGVIVFAPTDVGGLRMISENGGDVTTITTVSDPANEGHVYPAFLPDGDRVVYTLRSYVEPGPEYAGVYVSSISGREPTMRLLADRTNAIFASGFLLFARSGALMAQRFDPDTLALTGAARKLVDAVETSVWNFAIFGASAEGHLVYREESSQFELGWLDSSGRFDPVGVPRELFRQLQLSPDDSAALAVVGGKDGGHDIWRIDLSSRRRTRLTFAGSNWFPKWSPDSRQVLFGDYHNGHPRLLIMPASGGESKVLNAAPSEDHVAKDWSSDGRYILYTRGAGYEDGAAGTTDLSLFDLQAGTSRVVAPGVEGAAALSPDGRWVAYNSGDYGLNQVYVASLSGTSRWQISSSQGRRPVWRRDGRQIAFQQGETRIVGTAFSPDTGVAMGAEEVLFEQPGLRAFSLTSDFSRALVAVDPNAGRTPLTVVLNWTAELAGADSRGSR